jgi:hypothetical protein
MNTTELTYRAAGTSDEITTCDVCGKEELKGTVRLVIDDDNSEIFAGVNCAAKLSGKPVKGIRDEIRVADQAERIAAQREQDAHHAAMMADSTAWLAERGLERNFSNMKLYRAAREGR